jgi:RecB family exonuclease
MYQKGKYYLSKSGLMMYERCPLSFRFRYVDRLETARTRKYVKGKDVHELFHQFFSNCHIEDGKVSAGFEVPPPYVREMEFFLRVENQRYRQFLNGTITKYEPISLEEHYFNHKLGIHGFVDRVNEVPGGYSLVEYKTGSNRVSDVAKELAFYTLLDFGFEITHWEIYFTKREEVVFMEVEDSLLESVEETVSTVLEGIREGRFYPCKSVGTCSWCDYKWRCPEWVPRLRR